MGKTVNRTVKVAAAMVPRRSPRLIKIKMHLNNDAVPINTRRIMILKKSKHLAPCTLSRGFETRYEAKGYSTVIGVDEAGRGPLAGPVVAAACHIPPEVTITGINDSKTISEPQREALFELLTTHPGVTYAVHVNSAQRIDEINVLQATLESMTKSVNLLAKQLHQNDKIFVLVDGNTLPPMLKLPAEAVVKGDAKVLSIAAASIIAKVTRDRIMRKYDIEYPQYGLAQHKGYPTRAHVAAISKHGPSEIHRMTFAPLRHKM